MGHPSCPALRNSTNLMPHIGLSRSLSAPLSSLSSAGPESLPLPSPLPCGSYKCFLARSSHKCNSSNCSSLTISVMCSVACLVHFWHFIAVVPHGEPSRVSSCAILTGGERVSSRGPGGGCCSRRLGRAVAGSPTTNHRRHEQADCDES